MPFSSSPELDDGDSYEAQPGVTIGGGGRDASREQQLLALKEVRDRELAEKTAARIAEERERRVTAARIASEAREKSERREAAKAKAETLVRTSLAAVAVLVLGYLVIDAFRSRPRK